MNSLKFKLSLKSLNFTNGKNVCFCLSNRLIFVIFNEIISISLKFLNFDFKYENIDRYM